MRFEIFGQDRILRLPLSTKWMVLVVHKHLVSIRKLLIKARTSSSFHPLSLFFFHEVKHHLEFSCNLLCPYFLVVIPVTLERAPGLVEKKDLGEYPDLS